MAGYAVIEIGEGMFFITLSDKKKKIVEMWEIDKDKLSISLAAWEALKVQKGERK